MKNKLYDFIEKARKVHGDKYDYSKVKYINNKTKVCIICPIHGEFWQTPSVHINNKSNCPKCSYKNGAKSRSTTLYDFIEKAKKIHGDKYDYSKVEYCNNSTKICIVCPEHGEFWQTPSHHLRGQGCPKCFSHKGYEKNTSIKTKKLTTENFIEKAKKVHGDKYDYSKVKYINNKTKVCIVCPIHGEFYIRPDMHLNGQGCKKCSNIRNGLIKRKTTEQFIKEAKQIHGDKYDYSKVKYINTNTKICIICPIHGEFWQTPFNHLNGNGCKKCDVSLLENDVIELLKHNEIPYIFRERKLPWLKGLELDFYLPQYNIAIECQGIQHFIDKHFFEPLKVIQERDNRKKELCKKNGIRLLYYSNLKIEYPYFVFEDKNKLLTEIINEKR